MTGQNRGDTPPDARPVRMGILALDGCLASSVTGPADVFRVADVLACDTPAGETPPCGASANCRENAPRHLSKDTTHPGFAVDILTGNGQPAECLGGITLHGAPLRDARPDVLFLPAFYGTVEAHLNSPVVVEIGRLAAQGTVICGVCAGVFLMAASGVLDGGEATTHWGLADRFSELFPQIRLRSGAMIVDRGHTVCAGGVTAWADLSLHLVARFGSPELAAVCSRTLLIDPARRSQTPYASSAFPRTHGDASVLAVQDMLEREFARDLSLRDMARHGDLTERTLQRRFRKATGQSPREYLRHVRVEAARRLLESTTLTLDEVTDRVGYADTPSFGRLFRNRTGLSPGSYRKRFSLPAGG